MRFRRSLRIFYWKTLKVITRVRIRYERTACSLYKLRIRDFGELELGESIGLAPSKTDRKILPMASFVADL